MNEERKESGVTSMTSQPVAKLIYCLNAAKFFISSTRVLYGTSNVVPL